MASNTVPARIQKKTGCLGGLIVIASFVLGLLAFMSSPSSLALLIILGTALGIGLGLAIESITTRYLCPYCSNRTERRSALCPVCRNALRPYLSSAWTYLVILLIVAAITGYFIAQSRSAQKPKAHLSPPSTPITK